MEENIILRDFQSIIWEPCASPDFLVDVILTNYSKPTVRDQNLKHIGGKPNFIVLLSKEVHRGFDGGHPRNCGKAMTFELVLMDGSFTCFVARLNSGIIAKALNGSRLIPGAKVTVLDHEFIWLFNDGDDPISKRVVMFIKEFEWEHPPTGPQLTKYRESLEVESWRCPDFNKDLFKRASIENVLLTKKILPLNYKMNDDLSWHWELLNLDGLRKGYWIQAIESKRLWRDRLQSEKKKRTAREMMSYVSEDESCDCMHYYDLKKCILELYPLGRVCRKDVYDQVHDRLGGSVAGDNFEELKPNHKRWSMYWYYSVNILGVTGKQRKKLPNCLVQFVRMLYPDPVGVTYTGFIDKEDVSD